MPSFVQLFFLRLHANIFAQCWKHAFVQLILKKGSNYDPSKTLPLALTYILSKFFETILNSRSLDHVESRSLLSNHQHGLSVLDVY